MMMRQQQQQQQKKKKSKTKTVVVALTASLLLFFFSTRVWSFVFFILTIYTTSTFVSTCYICFLFKKKGVYPKHKGFKNSNF